MAAKPDFDRDPSAGAGKAAGARGRLRGILRAGALALGLVVLLAGRTLLRGGDLPGQAGGLSTSARDVTLAVHVRRALLDDPALAPLNLGVKVQDGTVTLVGPVPARELAQQALQQVSKVRGVSGVKSELYLARGTQREVIRFPLSGEAPTKTEAASPGTGSSTLTGRVPAIELPPSGRTATAGPPPAPLPQPAPPPPRPVLPAPRPDGREWAPTPTPGPGVSLLAPILEPPQAPTPAPPAAEPLGPAVERVRQADPRFRAIHVEIKGTTVRLSGPGVPGEHIMALAQALSVVPGIDRVLIQSSPYPPR